MVFIFGFIALLFIGGVGALAFIMTRMFGGERDVAMAVWMVALALACTLPVLAFLVASQAFRRIARPLGNIMTAADSVANGDLSARVPENGPGDFSRLSHSFNHMISELERADQQRRNLTADVAHELRTPLHIIQGNLEGILDGVYQPTPEQIEILLDETRSLSRLVDDLQTLSQVETGQLHLENKPVDIAELLEDAQTSFSGQAEAAGINLRLQIDGDPKNLTVCGDAGRLDQVLSNLITNALRYTPSGGSITLHGDSEGERVQISVRDTGVGIPPQELEYIFDRFWKGDRVRTHQKGVGSGLGLAISKKLVEAQGGDIRVESQLGSGSMFIIELPLVKDGELTERSVR
jgi:two-component system OmpR family sensor kinase/two-component system sensor histidine kinase BaeS